MVSLLHPAIVPFEPKLLADERRGAKLAGLEFIHIPMLPWVGQNQDSVERIKTLALNGGGRYYVHCYLGKDRNRLAQRIVESVAPSIHTEALQPGRKIQTRDKFDLGEVIRLDDKVYLTPYPTDEEFAAYILSGNFNRVVSLLDPETPGDSSLIKKEEEILETYGLPLETLPVSKEPYDPYQVMAAAYRVSALPRPVVVHAFRSDSFRAQAFVQAFTTKLPPLPPRLFDAPMERGKVWVIAPNLALGPRPTAAEFRSYLYQRGVRRFVYLGDPESSEAAEDRKTTQQGGLSWEAIEPVSSNLNHLNERTAIGGPWYVYGPSVLAHHIAGAHSFERGEILAIDIGVYLTPYPTKEEFLRYILGGQVKQVVTLLDPADSRDAPWLSEEQNLLSEHGMPLEIVPISASLYDPHLMVQLARRTRALPRPLVVHAMRSDSFRAQAFVQAFRTNLPPLPPLLFEDPMERGKVSVIAANVALGPRPTGPEFESYLHKRGIRNYVYVGSSKSPEAEEDREATREAGYHWEAVDPTATDPEDLYERLTSGGPWYLYGPSLSTVQKSLVRRRGPAVPKRLLRFPNNEAHAALNSGEQMKFARDHVAGPGFLEQANPNLRMTALLGPLLLLYAWSAASLVGWLKSPKSNRTPNH